MKTYTVHFRTDAKYAIEEFNAETPEQALAAAQQFYAVLDFMPYDDHQDVNEIEVFDGDEKQVAIWYDDELRLRLAASELLETLDHQTTAAQAVIDNWSNGDLAGAVRRLDACIEASRAIIAKARGAAQ